MTSEVQYINMDINSVHKFNNVEQSGKKPNKPGKNNYYNELCIIFELYRKHNILWYGIAQLLFFFVGIAIIFVPIIKGKIYISWIIGLIIIILSCYPKPFIITLYNVGTTWIIFDEENNEIFLNIGHYGDCYSTEIEVCSFSQFRGIAVYENGKSMLILSQRIESLECKDLELNNVNYDTIIDKICVYWNGNHFNDRHDVYFGKTIRKFESGIMAQGGMEMQRIEYDYYNRKATEQEMTKSLNRIRTAKRKDDASEYINKKRKNKNAYTISYIFYTFPGSCVVLLFVMISISSLLSFSSSYLNIISCLLLFNGFT
mmetsp:Transcript_63552/g.77744  ORF Transcript_63552/g.77744 Transcript_63552/m.77744 type:complete len:315 (+) Transcript_63552:57-1001(+)